MLHKTKKLKKAVYDANNARNRDSYSITKSNNMLKDDKAMSITKVHSNINVVENSIIDMLDCFNEQNKTIEKK